MNINRSQRRLKRKMHIRRLVRGSAKRPRVSVFKSNRYLFVQAVDDEGNKVIAALWERTLTSKKEEKPADRAERLGEEFSKQLKKKKCEMVVFDRSGYKYHGRVARLADGIRSGGIKF